MSEKTGPGRQKSLYIPEKNGETKTDEAEQRVSKGTTELHKPMLKIRRNPHTKKKFFILKIVIYIKNKETETNLFLFKSF